MKIGEVTWLLYWIFTDKLRLSIDKVQRQSYDRKSLIVRDSLMSRKATAVPSGMVILCRVRRRSFRWREWRNNMAKNTLTHVPGERLRVLLAAATPDQIEGELEQLRPSLMGNEIFGRSRGTWWQTLSNLVDSVTDDSTKTSREVQNELDALFRDIKIMALMKHDLLERRLYLARRELDNALTEPEYLIPDETFPLEDTEPVTAVMFAPRVTLLLMRWIYTIDERVLFQMKNGYDVEDLRHNPGNTLDHDIEVTNQLFAALPSLMDALKHRDNEWEERPGGQSVLALCWKAQIMAAYAIDVLAQYEPLSGAFEKPAQSQGGTFGFQIDVKKVLSTFCPDKLDALNHWQTTCGLVFLVPGTQDQVLARYTRNQQRNIATWQFHAPKCISWVNQNIGLHLEQEHRDFAKLRPALISKGVASGCGAMILLNRDNELYPLTSWGLLWGGSARPLRFNFGSKR